MIVADRKFWRLMHSHFIDAVVKQEDETSIALVALVGGVNFVAFMNALDRERLRVRSTLEGDDLPCCTLEILADAGWIPLVAVPAKYLGLDPEGVRCDWDACLDDDIADLLGEA